MTIDRILQLQSFCCADLCCDAADLHGLRQTYTDGFSGIQCASNIVDGVVALRSNHFNFIDAFHRTDHSRICLREYCIHEQVFDLGDRVTQERLDTFFTNFNDIHLCSIGFQAFNLISLRFIQLDLCLRDVGQAVIDDAVLCGDECIHACDSGFCDSLIRIQVHRDLFQQVCVVDVAQQSDIFFHLGEISFEHFSCFFDAHVVLQGCLEVGDIFN